MAEIAWLAVAEIAWLAVAEIAWLAVAKFAWLAVAEIAWLAVAESWWLTPMQSLLISCVDGATVLRDGRVDEPVYYTLHAEHPTARGPSRIANISKLRIRVMCINW